MYPKLKHPKRVTEKWLNQVFMPLSDYLEREYPDEAGQIMSFMEFFPDDEKQLFHYRNRITKDYIVIDRAGSVISCGEEVFQCKYGEPHEIVTVRPPREERHIHPNVSRWMSKRLSKREDEKYGDEVSIFLQEVWGPIVNFDFSDLKVGYPLRGTRPPYCLYIYPAKFQSLIAVQFVGDEIVEKRCSYAQYRKYERCERAFVFEGWHVITIIRECFERDMDQFRFYVSKAIEMALPRDPAYVLTEAGRKLAEEILRADKE